MKSSKHFKVLFLVIAIIVSTSYFFQESKYLFQVLFFIFGIYLLILYVGVTRYRLNYFSKAIHSGKEKGLSLTFDDGPNPNFTNKVLDILKKHQVKATFFIIGKNIDGNEVILKRIIDEGHIVGNHSFSHVKFFNVISPKKIVEDIEKCDNSIEKVTNLKPLFFRTPFGLTSPKIAKALKKVDHVSVGWDFRSFDTMAKSETKLLYKLKSKASKSSILLLHDNNEITINVLDAFLNFCKKNGIKIVSLDKMIGLKPYKE